MGWQVMICRPSDWTGRDRVAIWRQLHRVGALSLGNGTWVLSDDPLGCRSADAIDEFIQRRSCHMLRFVVSDADPRGPEVVSMVHSVLDREWERFARAVDQFEGARASHLSVDDAVEALEDLRDRYADLLESDPRDGSAACATADRLAALVRDLEPRARQRPAWRRDELPRARLHAGGLTQPGGVHRVDLVPFPGFGWEHELAEFERRIYLPSDRRPQLHLGIFTLRCAADEVEAELDAITHRISAFHQSLGVRPDQTIVPVGAGARSD